LQVALASRRLAALGTQPLRNVAAQFAVASVVAVDFEASATCEKSSSQSEAMIRCTEALPARVAFFLVTFSWRGKKK
jgi:hypothetical protein